MTHIYSIAYLRQVAGTILNHQLSWSDESAKEFRANFGLSERSVLSLWNQLVDRNPNKLLPAKAKLKHLLWALLYLKVYATETVLSQMAKTTRKTFRIWVAKILDAIFGLVPRKASPRLVPLLPSIALTCSNSCLSFQLTDPLGESLSR